MHEEMSDPAVNNKNPRIRAHLETFQTQNHTQMESAFEKIQTRIIKKHSIIPTNLDVNRERESEKEKEREWKP